MDNVGIGFAILLFTAVMVAGLAFWIWALVDAIRVPDDSLYKSGTKLVWVLVIVLIGFIGAIVYLAVGRPDGGAAAAIASWGGGARTTPPAPDGALPPPPA
ncbi:MAG TPA: PLD nuclease N-terminal domain-containing protein [Actinomycetota bacterium]|nr:PLD nuclease N-terminal domain-containing protein [Actinomycetota bacterium]